MKLPAVAVAACVLALPGAALGAEFQVRSCGDSPSGSHDGWGLSTTDGTTLEGHDGCASGGGLEASEALGPGPLAGAGDEAWWTFTAPPGTRVVAMLADRYLHTYGDAGWMAELRADSTVLEHCHIVSGVECSIGAPGGSAAGFAGLDAQTLRIGGFCVPEGGHVACERGHSLHRLETYLYAATVTLDDQVAPSASLAATGLADGDGWKTGPGTLTTTAEDNTGVRRRLVQVDGTTVAAIEAPTAAAGGCRTVGEGVAYSFTQPCLGSRGVNGTRTDTLDPSSWPQGVRQLRMVALDTGGGQTATPAREVRIDTMAPPAPSLAGPEGWTTAVPVLDIAGQDPAGGSPLSRTALEACRRDGCVSAEAEMVADGAQVDLPNLPDGAWEVTARVRDAAGHLSAVSASLTLRVDRTPPELGVPRPSGGTQTAGSRVRLTVDAEDRASGLDRVTYELSTDGGPYVAHGDELVLAAGRVYRVRATAVDLAGNATTREGEPFAATPAPASVPAIGTPLPPAAIAPARHGSARCAVRITMVRSLPGGTLLVRGTVRAGDAVTAAVGAGRRTTARDRSTTSGAFAVRLRAHRTLRGRQTLRVSSRSCSAATRRVTLRR